MKKKINKQTHTGTLCVDGRPDRTKAPLIKTDVKPATVIKPTPSTVVKATASESIKFVSPDLPGSITATATRVEPSGYADTTFTSYRKGRKN